jgi:hypothetical protein
MFTFTFHVYMYIHTFGCRTSSISIASVMITTKRIGTIYDFDLQFDLAFFIFEYLALCLIIVYFSDLKKHFKTN